MREYVVILKNYEDLDEFYDDMETPGGTEYIPHRMVECSVRKPVSRNTFYMLTDAEANQIRSDARVESVELSANERGLEVRLSYTQTSAYWDKSAVNSNGSHKNYALYRCTLDANSSGWGTDILNPPATPVSDSTTLRSGTINITASGKNVDVVVMDGLFNPAHPEFAVNVDGSGGSRAVQYNWLQLSQTVTGVAAGVSYVYTPYEDPNYKDPSTGASSNQRTLDNDHGAHCACSAAGNLNGWARDANIYNIGAIGTAPTPIPNYYLFDYVRVWHQNKPINPATGVKNPTIITGSFGLGFSSVISNVTKVMYRGTIYNGPFTKSQLQSYGIFTYTNSSSQDVYSIPARDANMDSDIAACIAAGIIIVAAAGNDFTPVYNPTDADYNNYFIDSVNGTWYYMQGSSPGASPGVICVGAVDATSDETKAQFSNNGPRVDIFAPGTNIMSAVNSTLGTTYDSRNATYLLTKKTGTSQATPQVTGILACALETYPYFNQTQAKAYIQKYAKLNQVSQLYSANYQGVWDVLSLNGAGNRFLHYNRERPVDGAVFPKLNTGARPTSGQVWPRPRIYRFGPQR